MNYTVDDLKDLMESLSGGEKKYFSMTNDVRDASGKPHVYIQRLCAF